MRIIPVLDVKGGGAVHAVAGDRAHYRPLRSILHAEPDPLALARAFREQLGAREIYLADLDAIAGQPPAQDLYRAIRELGLTLWLDAGVRTFEDFERVAADRASEPSPPGRGWRRSRRMSDGMGFPIRGLPIPDPLRRSSPHRVAATLSPGVSAKDQPPPVLILGLETLAGPEALRAIVSQFDRNQLAFSLDLRDGRPLIAPDARWGTNAPQRLAANAIEAGIRRLIVLDLARVGTGRGPGTLELIRELAALPGAEIVAGGGVAGADDLKALADAGASAVLVGSALHDGRLASWTPLG